MPAKIIVTRKQLFEDLWNIGYEKSAEKWGVSLNELLEVYEKYNIPMPDSEYFAKKHKGKDVFVPQLPDCGESDENIELQTVWVRRKKVDSILGSKANVICILQTLEDYSDANKALSVYDIICLMEENYRIKVDRRTVYNAIELLKDLGYDIDLDKKGSKNYYSLNEKILEPSEVKIIMDSLALNPLLPAKLGDEISNKIYKYLAKRNPIHRTWYWRSLDKFIKKYDTDSLLYCYLDEIDAALIQGKKVEFKYLKYDTNGNKVPYREKKYVVNPYQVKLEDGMYHLFCSEENGDDAMQVRLDRMSDVRMTDEKADRKHIAGGGKWLGVTYSPEHNLYYSNTTLKCDNSLIDKVTTDFLHDLEYIQITDNNDGKTFNFTMPFINAEFIMQWALSVADRCEIVEPLELREMIIEKIKNNKYGV